MSFRGRIIKREKVGPIELVTTEYPTPKRRKVIWWMGEGKVVELGELITYYTDEPRKSDYENIKWKPLYFEVKLKDIADPSESIDMCDYEGKYEFDELEDAEDFINRLKCKGITYGGIEIDSRASFKRWKKAVEAVMNE